QRQIVVVLVVALAEGAAVQVPGARAVVLDQKCGQRQPAARRRVVKAVVLKQRGQLAQLRQVILRNEAAQQHQASKEKRDNRLHTGLLNAPNR
nr:hypothetical protein [Tanacetum cinerariifolium]